ncbi:MAG: hypothetical protein OXE75_07455 [bacterium]|nr:hypothetical protein [bacterium]
MTKPTNVLLDEASRAAARRRAAEQGLSVSAYIRDLIHADDAAARADSGDIGAIVGVLGSGDEPTDIARDKRRMVAEAFGGDFEARLGRRGDNA